MKNDPKSLIRTGEKIQRRVFKDVYIVTADSNRLSQINKKPLTNTKSVEGGYEVVKFKILPKIKNLLNVNFFCKVVIFIF